jgi:HTH-type transcriptional regulator/antitoxin HigA
METLKYKVIKSVSQYKAYCLELEQLVDQHPKSITIRDEIDLLTLLIHNYDEKHTKQPTLDPIQLLKAFMDDNQWKAKDIAEFLGVSKGYVSDILHYKKGLSKEVIRKLATRFKVKQEAFNRVYPMVQTDKKQVRASAR